MAAHDNVNKYQFHLNPDKYVDHEDYGVYLGDLRVADMGVRRWPDEHRVSTLYADKAHRHVVPTLLGLAANRAEAAGLKLTPSTSLSKHSSRLVQNLQQRGLVTKSEEYPQTDYETDFDISEASYDPHRPGERLTTGTVNEGRQYIRRAIKERKGR